MSICLFFWGTKNLKPKRRDYKGNLRGFVALAKARCSILIRFVLKCGQTTFEMGENLVHEHIFHSNSPRIED
jgi:hypothetical protein